MTGSKSLSRRSFLSVVGLGTAGAALSACGAAATPQVVEKIVQETVVVEVQVTPAGIEPADLAVWVWWPDPVQPLNQMSAFFMGSNPGVNVSVEAPTDYWTKLQTALAGGAGPDIYFMNNVNYWSWAHKGVLIDLDQYIAGDANMQDNLANSWQAAIDFYKFQGKNYGLPFMYTTVVLYYNADLLAEKGLTPLAEIEDTLDWNVWREYADKLTERDGDKVGMWGTMSTQGIETGWLNFVRANGTDFLNSDATQCIIDGDASVEAWELLTAMRLDDNVSPSPEALQAEGAQSMFMTGKIAVLPGGSWTMNTLNQQLTDFKYDIAIMPRSPNTGESGGTSNIVGLVINKDTKSQDQAWALMTHYLSKYSQDVFAKSNILAPVRNDSAELYYDPALGPDNRGAAFRMQQWTTALPTHPVVTWGEMNKPITEWQNEIFEGRAKVKDGLTAMAAEVNDLFAQAG